MTNRMLLLAIVGLVAVMIGCEKESTSPNNGVAVIEGSVSYYPPTMAIGGEADPFGFILTDYQWLSGAPTFSYSRVPAAAAKTGRRSRSRFHAARAP